MALDFRLMSLDGKAPGAVLPCAAYVSVATPAFTSAVLIGTLGSFVGMVKESVRLPVAVGAL